MKYFMLLAMFAVGLVVSHSVEAQSNTSNAIRSQAVNSQDTSLRQSTPAVLTNASVKKVGFRLTQWKTIHSHSTEEAQETVSALTKIGCEVESDNHGNHIDVRYRCTEWKSLKLATDQLVNQWSTWCAAKGMETVVINPPKTTKKATVSFRLPSERSVHLHDKAQAAQIVNTLQLIGCQVKTNQHGDHIDATYSCPDWTTIELQTDANAHSWQKWLDESGFETQHSH